MDQGSISISYKLINKFSETIDIVENILLHQEIISVDCEGIFLSKEGRLTLLQIGLSSGEVYIFDILKGGSLMFIGTDPINRRGLKYVLENKSILKILHDCRSDWDSLLHQYDIRLYNFLDTQELYYLYKLFYSKEATNPISLNNYLNEIMNINLIYKHQTKGLMSEDPEIWGKRPLIDLQLKYASEDVIYLIQSWRIFLGLLNENIIEISYFLSIIKVINKEMYDDFRYYLYTSVIQMYGFIKENHFKEGIDISDKDLIEEVGSYDYVESYFKVKSKEKRKDNMYINVGLNFKNFQRDSYMKLISQIENDEKRFYSGN